MVVIHNIIIRGLNSIYLQAPHVKPKDYADFIGYCLCWSDVLHTHHHCEETIAFPEIEKSSGVKGIMDANVHQHGEYSSCPLSRTRAYCALEAFSSGVKDYQTYLLDVKSSPATFSGSRLCEIIDAFATILLTHLSEEIPTLLSLSKFGDKIDMDNIWEKDGKAAVGMSDKTAGLAFFFLNCDTTFEGGKWAAFPPIPRPIRWVFTHICTWPNRAYWKFASCDYSGKPQDLYAEK
jgi:hypothetical protein